MTIYDIWISLSWDAAVNSSANVLYSMCCFSVLSHLDINKTGYILKQWLRAHGMSLGFMISEWYARSKICVSVGDSSQASCFPRQEHPRCYEYSSVGAVLWDQCAFVDLLKGHKERWHYFIHSDVPLELLTQGSDACPNQSTGHNVLKPREVRRAVESQAVGRDVPSTADSCKASQRVLE